jgi:hypothetical protein
MFFFFLKKKNLTPIPFQARGGCEGDCEPSGQPMNSQVDMK